MSDTESPTSGYASPTIFILEDEPLIAMEVEEGLLVAGFEIAAVLASCVDGLKWLETNSPDAAVLDIELRDGNCAEIAALLHNRKIPFVVYSGSLPNMDHVDPVFTTGRWVCKPAATTTEIADAVAECVSLGRPSP